MKRCVLSVLLIATIILGAIPTASAVYLVDQEAGTIIWYDDSEFDENGYWQPDASSSGETYYNLVLENNLEKRQTWLNPGDYLEVNDEDFRQLSNRIVAGITDDYEKLHAIHDWVCENVYYDYESYNVGFGFGPVFYVNDENDLRESERWESMSRYEKLMHYKRGVCWYYTGVFETLTRAQGIPCISIDGLTTDRGWTEGNYSPDSTTDHAWNEAYVNGKWVIVDTTWDSGNRYNGSEYIKGSVMQTYFDMPLDRFSRNHKIVTYGNTKDSDIPSAWAQATIADAMENDIVPYAIQHSYRNEISRKEFCQLIIQCLSRIDSQIAINTASLPSPFSDVNDASVTLANQLGIVNGTGGNSFNPDSRITRQEAAVMLSRMAKVLKLLVGTPTVSYSDSKEIANWALEGVNDVTALGVMNGVGNAFDPTGTYTVEQAIVTAERVFEAAS